MNSNTFFIDTSSSKLTVALLRQATINYEILPQVTDGNNLSLKHIDMFLEKNGVQLNNLTDLAYIIGPGSFTGLRVGVSILQAINLIYSIPVFGISRLHLLAQQGYKKSNARRVILCLNALRDEYYFGEYRFDQTSNIMLPIFKDCLYSSKKLNLTLEEQNEPYVIISDCSKILSSKNYHAKDIINIMAIQQDIDSIAKVIEYHKSNNIFIEPNNILPQYLKEPHTN